MNDKLKCLALDVERPGRMKLRDKHGRPIQRLDDAGKVVDEAWIDVWSADSEVARRALRQAIDRRVAARTLQADPSQQEADKIGLIVALTAGWHLLDPSTGEVIDEPFSPETARELYASPGTAFIGEQVDTYAADRRNF